MLKVKDKTTAELVALSKNETLDLMDRFILSSVENKRVLSNLLSHQRITGEIIEEIYKNKAANKDIFLEIAENRNTPKEILEDILATGKLTPKQFFSRVHPSILVTLDVPKELMKERDKKVVSSVGAKEDAIEEIYERAKRGGELDDEFAEYFALNPFTGSDILNELMDKYSDKEQILLNIASNRSVDENILENILGKMSAKNGALINAFTSNTSVSQRLGDRFYAKFKDHISSKAAENIVKRGTRFLSDINLVDLFNRIKERQLKQKIKHSLIKERSPYALSLPGKIQHMDRMAIINKWSIDELIDGNVEPSIFIPNILEYWESMKSQANEEALKKMSSLFEKYIWETLDDKKIKEILLVTRNENILYSALSSVPAEKKQMFIDAIIDSAGKKKTAWLDKAASKMLNIALENKLTYNIVNIMTKTMSDEEKVYSFKNIVLDKNLSEDDKAEIARQVIPYYSGIVEGIKSIRGASSRILKMEKIVKDSGSEKLMAEIEKKRVFVDPKTEEGKEHKKKALFEILDEIGKDGKLKQKHKTLAYGPLSDYFVGGEHNVIKKEGDAIKLLEYIYENYGTRKMEDIVMRIASLNDLVFSDRLIQTIGMYMDDIGFISEKVKNNFYAKIATEIEGKTENKLKAIDIAKQLFEKPPRKIEDLIRAIEDIEKENIESKLTQEENTTTTKLTQ